MAKKKKIVAVKQEASLSERVRENLRKFLAVNDITRQDFFLQLRAAGYTGSMSKVNCWLSHTDTFTPMKLDDLEFAAFVLGLSPIDLIRG